MENKTGEKPIHHKILVLPDQVSETAGLIAKPETVIYEETRAQVIGTLIAKSDMAFCDDGQRWNCDIPQVGQKVRFARYAGQMTDKIDGVHYRLMNDTDVISIKEEV